MKNTLAITGLGSLTPLGITPEKQWNHYLTKKTAIVWDEELQAYAAPQTPETEALVKELRSENAHYERLDPTVLLAILAGRKALAQAGWKDGNFGINIGSSRGPTRLIEQYHEAFLKRGITPTKTSPSTTAGNISSWLAQDLKSSGPTLSHSITCSTALHSLLNGVAWLESGMATKFMVGGSEAALTPFTIAQMRAMRLMHEEETPSPFPCQALNMFKKKNTMALGEASGVACIEVGKKKNALAYITGVGYATEGIEHAVSLSAHGDCFQKSMKMALGDTKKEEVDVVVMHAPGTIKGDSSEMEAIKGFFGETLPLLTTNKWKIGHTFGASGLLSLEMAVQMLQHQTFIGVAYLKEPTEAKPLKNILINAVGFGGNAVSILISKA